MLIYREVRQDAGGGAKNSLTYLYKAKIVLEELALRLVLSHILNAYYTDFHGFFSFGTSERKAKIDLSYLALALCFKHFDRDCWTIFILKAHSLLKPIPTGYCELTWI